MKRICAGGARQPTPHCMYHVGTQLQRVRADRPIFISFSTAQGASRSSLRRQATFRRDAVRIILRCPIHGCPFVAPLPGDESDNGERLETLAFLNREKRARWKHHVRKGSPPAAVGPVKGVAA